MTADCLLKKFFIDLEYFINEYKTVQSRTLRSLHLYFFSGLLTFKKSETVLWSIAKHYYHYYYWWEICHFSLVLISNACKLRLQLHIESVVQMVGDVSLNHLKLAFTMRKSLLN